jgi:hypothetical protein
VRGRRQAEEEQTMDWKGTEAGCLDRWDVVRRAPKISRAQNWAGGNESGHFVGWFRRIGTAAADRCSGGARFSHLHRSCVRGGWISGADFLAAWVRFFYIFGALEFGTMGRFDQRFKQLQVFLSKGGSSSSSTTLVASMPTWSSAGKAACLQPPWWRPCESVVGARCSLVAKWCVPGDLVAASGCGSTPEGGRRALCLCSSAEMPWGRRRLVAATLMDSIALHL